MKKETINIINKFETIRDAEDVIHETTKSIEARDENGNLYWRFVFENIKCAPQDVLDNFFMSLYELQHNGYELKFICKEIKEEG